MNKYNFLNQTPVQYEQKCLCVICIDTSSSMSGGWYRQNDGNSPIEELNRGLQSFIKEIQKDTTLADRLEIAIVEFNSNIYVTEPTLVEDLILPHCVASGKTFMSNAITESINIIEARKKWYKQTLQPYYRPWLILITDGEPNDIKETINAAIPLKNAVDNKQVSFLPVAVQHANLEFLNLIAFDYKPMKLKGLRFTQFFEWLSNSMGTITRSQPNIMPDITLNTNQWEESYE